MVVFGDALYLCANRTYDSCEKRAHAGERYVRARLAQIFIKSLDAHGAERMHVGGTFLQRFISEIEMLKFRPMRARQHFGAAN
jgi:hypothetical protein